MKDQPLMNHATTITTHQPAWWTDQHSSSWERVKGAMERDWTQTKADFSNGRSANLNQSVADTIKQSVGSMPVPPPGIKTRSTGPKVAAKKAERARAKMEKESAKATEAISKAHDDMANERLSLSEKTSEARTKLATQKAKIREQRAEAHEKARDKMAAARVEASGRTAAAHQIVDAAVAKDQTEIVEAEARRDAAAAKWHAAEQELRYGFAARSQYPTDRAWDTALEGTLRGEWDTLETGKSWNTSRAGVRRGWEFAEKEP